MPNYYVRLKLDGVYEYEDVSAENEDEAIEKAKVRAADDLFFEQYDIMDVDHVEPMEAE